MYDINSKTDKNHKMKDNFMFKCSLELYEYQACQIQVGLLHKLLEKLLLKANLRKDLLSGKTVGECRYGLLVAT